MDTGEDFAKALRPMKIFIASVLCVYFLVGLSTFSLFRTGRDKNVTPFFHWFLFALVPNENGETHYELRITAVHGSHLATPVLFSRAEGIIADPDSNRARDGIRRLAGALAAGDGAEAQVVRAQFEAAYLPPGISYDVVAITYRPLVRFRTGETDPTVTLGSFKTAL
jgi:hypothetical protein